MFFAYGIENDVAVRHTRIEMHTNFHSHGYGPRSNKVTFLDRASEAMDEVDPDETTPRCLIALFLISSGNFRNSKQTSDDKKDGFNHHINALNPQRFCARSVSVFISACRHLRQRPINRARLSNQRHPALKDLLDTR